MREEKNMKSPEQFNPSDQKYKKVADLPTEEQEKFLDIPEELGGGFHYKNLVSQYLGAHIQDKISKTLGKKAVGFEQKMNNIHTQALEYNRIEIKYKAEENPDSKEAALEYAREYGDFPPQDKTRGVGDGSFLHQFHYVTYPIRREKDFRDDKEVVMEVIKRSSYKFEEISEKLRADKEVALEAVRGSGENIKFISPELQADREVVIEALRKGGFSCAVLDYASPELKGDKEVVQMAISRNPLWLAYASDELRDDGEIVLAAVTRNGNALKYASPRLQGDKDIVLTAIKKDPKAFIYASLELRGDKEIAISAALADRDTSSWHPIAKSISPELQNDPEIMLQLAQKNNIALQFCSPELRSNKSFVRAALDILAKSESRGITGFTYESRDNTNGFIRIISDKLRADKNIMSIAIKISPSCLKYASDELRNDLDIIKLAISFGHKDIFQYASPEIKQNRDIMLELIKKSADYFKDADSGLQNDRAFILEAVAVNPEAFYFATRELKIDKNFVLKVATVRPEALQFASSSLLGDPEFIVEIAATKPNALAYIPEKILREIGISVSEINIMLQKNEQE